MTTTSTTTMEERLPLLVTFGEQSKKINIRIDSTVNDVEREVIAVYEFKQEDFLRVQIQYYDRDFEQYVDLDAKSDNDLQNLLKYLSTQPRHHQTEVSWRLKIIVKMIKRKLSPLRQCSHSDEFYQFQQTNEIRQISSDMSPDKPKKSCRKHSLSVPPLSNSETLITTEDSDYQLTLNFLLENEIRSQYEGDVFPLTKNKQTNRIAGVLIATKHLDLPDRLSDFNDPAAFFNIPSSMIDENWSLWFFVVFSSPENDNYHINAWKGMYYHPRDVKHEPSDAENPLEKKLTSENLLNQYLLLPLKICSLNSKKEVEKKPTQLLPKIGDRLSSVEDLTSDGKRNGDLNTNWHQFRLAGLLVHNGQVVDRCISNSSSANPERGKKSL